MKTGSFSFILADVLPEPIPEQPDKPDTVKEESESDTTSTEAPASSANQEAPPPDASLYIGLFVVVLAIVALVLLKGRANYAATANE